MKWPMPMAEIVIFLLILVATVVVNLIHRKNQKAGEMILTSVVAILASFLVCVISNYCAFQAGQGIIAKDKGFKSLTRGEVYRNAGAVTIDNKSVTVIRDKQGKLSVYQFKENPPPVFVVTNDKDYLSVSLNSFTDSAKLKEIPIIMPEDDPLVEF
jgi:glucan phosphoethanolaminetransferase (alkaline phosphatase superfamily)